MRHVLLAAVLFSTAVKPDEVLGPMSINVDVHPSARSEYQLLRRPTPDTYSCSVLVTDAGKTERLGSAQLVAPIGSGTMVTDTRGKYAVEFTVIVMPRDTFNRAETHVTVRRGGEIVAEQSSTIALLHSTPPRNVPIR